MLHDRLTFSIQIHSLIDDRIVVPELIVLKYVQSVESSDTSHDILSDIFSEGDRVQASLDVGWRVV